MKKGIKVLSARVNKKGFLVLVDIAVASFAGFLFGCCLVAFCCILSSPLFFIISDRFFLPIFLYVKNQMYHSKVELIHLLLLFRLIHQGNTAFLCRQSLTPTLMKAIHYLRLLPFASFVSPRASDSSTSTKRLGYLGYAHQKRAARVKLIVILRITTVLQSYELTTVPREWLST